MGTERFERLRAIVLGAADPDPTARRRWLDDRCGAFATDGRRYSNRLVAGAVPSPR